MRPFLGIVLAFVFLSVASGTLVNVALPFIGEHFDAPESRFSWVVSGFMLTFGVFSAIHGRLGDVFGVRRLYLGGATLFLVCALLAAFAPSLEVLVGIRVVQGIGAAAIPALGATILTRTLPPHELGRGMGAFVATVGLSATVSPFIGGFLLEVADWHFVIAVPAIGLALLPFATRALPDTLDACPPARRFDWVGALLLSASASALLAVPSVAGRGLPWAIGVGGLGLGLAAAFLRWIDRVDEPFLPPMLARSPGFVATAITGAIVNGARFGSIVLVPILLEEQGVSATTIGLTLVPGAIALTLLSPTSGRLADRRGVRAAVVPGVAGLLATLAATGFLVDQGIFGVTLSLTLTGAAFAFVQPPLLSGLGAVVPKDAAGVGNGTYLMVFFLGGAFGVAVSLGVLAMQPVGTAAWLPGVGDDVGRFSNTVVVMTLLGLPALIAWPYLPASRTSQVAGRKSTGEPPS
ncbi:MAG: MFS transporter, partial [Myxococcota bacterium]